MQEIRKQIELNNTMTLLDLNGTATRFKSEFVITSKNPSRKYLIAVVTQTQLDNGDDIPFLLSEDQGVFARKVTYNLDVHLNHFISIKKQLDDADPDPFLCDVYIRLYKEEAPPEIKVPSMSMIKRHDLEIPESSAQGGQRRETFETTGLRDPRSLETPPEPLEAPVAPRQRVVQSPETFLPSENISPLIREELSKELYEKYVLKSEEQSGGVNTYLVIGVVSMIIFIIFLGFKTLHRSK